MQQPHLQPKIMLTSRKSTNISQKRTQVTAIDELLKYDPTRSKVTEKEWNRIVNHSMFTKVIKGMIEDGFPELTKVYDFVDKMAV